MSWNVGREFSVIGRLIVLAYAAFLTAKLYVPRDYRKKIRCVALLIVAGCFIQLAHDCTDVKLRFESVAELFGIAVARD